MLFAVLFEDDANRADDIRRQYMPAHLDFLERNASLIRAAGPLRDVDDTPTGGLWVVQADGREQVETLVQEDPFWTTGLRRSVRLLAWTQVFADGVRGGRQE
ncbi:MULTISPECIES: YciI family protein [unclassified Rhizobium]|uniref:YciI family protein n=1 Tax=unclassified Rhizobium TaxID=2613769 RepID=UPI001FFE09E6|nr:MULTISPECIES: YciI family protein [unclassified Rhizobium]